MLSSNGHGILIRSQWDLARYLDSGRLKIVLPEFTLPSADLFVYYPSRRNQAIRARAFIDFLVEQCNSTPARRHTSKV